MERVERHACLSHACHMPWPSRACESASPLFSSAFMISEHGNEHTLGNRFLTTHYPTCTAGDPGGRGTGGRSTSGARRRSASCRCSSCRVARMSCRVAYCWLFMLRCCGVRTRAACVHTLRSVTTTSWLRCHKLPHGVGSSAFGLGLGLDDQM